MKKSTVSLLLGVLFYCAFVTQQLNAQSKKNPPTNYWLSPYGLMQVKPKQGEVKPPSIPLKKNGGMPTILSVTDAEDVTIMSSATLTQSENSVFMDPNDDGVLTTYRAINSNNTTENNTTTPHDYGVNYSRTTNGGNTWWNGSSTGDDNDDPSVVIDLNGNEYIGYVRVVRDAMGEIIKYRIDPYVAYSTNGGSTFTEVQVDAGNYDDKDHLWVDNSRISPYSGRLYLVWTDLNDTDIFLSKSTNHGVSWSSRQLISNPFHRRGVGANVQTGPNGEVYVCWAIKTPDIETYIAFTKSTNGGTSFSTPLEFSILGHSTYDLGGGKTMDHGSYPSMTVNQQNGDIYIAVAERASTSDVRTDIMLYKSINGGTSFSSTPIRINQVGTNDQWSPWIACDEISGALTCIFYDSRDFTGNDRANTYVAVSYDGGATWEDGKVSDDDWDADGYINPGGLQEHHYSGDYIGIDTRYCHCLPVWTDTRNGNLLSYTSPFTLDCPQDLTLCNATIHEEAMYSVQQTITVAGSSICSYIVDNNGTTDGGRCVMQAGDYIRLGEGFHAEANTYFHALIDENCESYCHKIDEFVRSERNPSGDSPLKQAETGKGDNSKTMTANTLLPPIITLRTYPNPITDHFILQYEVRSGVSNDITIRIVNALGKEIMLPLTYQQMSGQYAVEFDASGWQAGAYTIIVQNPYSASTSRFLLVH
jgi:hypothetical protein